MTEEATVAPTTPPTITAATAYVRRGRYNLMSNEHQDNLTLFVKFSDESQIIASGVFGLDLDVESGVDLDDADSILFALEENLTKWWSTRNQEKKATLEKLRGMQDHITVALLDGKIASLQRSLNRAENLRKKALGRIEGDE